MAVLESIRELSTDLEEFGVKRMWLFGSASRGEDVPSDLDILVEFDSPPTLTGFMNLKFFLEERLGTRVDLHSRGSCPPRFLKRITPDLRRVA